MDINSIISKLYPEQHAFSRIGGIEKRIDVFKITGEHPEVLKLYHRNPQEKVFREKNALSLLSNRGLPIPCMIDWGIIDAQLTWLKMSFIDNDGDYENVFSALDASINESLCYQMGASLKLIHTAYQPSTFGDLTCNAPQHARVSDYVIPFYTDFLNNSYSTHFLPKSLFPVIDKKLKSLYDVFSEDAYEIPVIVHRDFWQRNILVKKESESYRIAGVIDFESSHIGEPTENLSRFLFCNWYRSKEIKIKYLEGYGIDAKLFRKIERKLLFYIIGYCLEVINWTFHSDKPYYDQAINTIIDCCNRDDLAFLSPKNS